MADEPNFEAWYASVAAGVTERLVASVGDPLLAREAAAEAFGRAYEKWSRVRRMESPEGWVYRTGQNLCRSVWRRRGIEKRALAKLPPAELVTVEPHDLDSVVRGHDVAAVEQQVEGLPPRMRQAVRLRYWHQMTEPMVAREMGISVGTASALLSQARQRLRSSLDPDDRRADHASDEGQSR